MSSAPLWLAPLVLLTSFQAPSSVEVIFNATGPGGLRIQGVTHGLTLSETPDAYVWVVPLEPVTTGIALRDRHMREKYLEVATYPNAELSLPRAGLSIPKDGAAVEGTQPATFAVHGKQHPVTVRYHATRAGKHITVQADFDIDLGDYGIATPGYLGVTVKPAVGVHVVCTLDET